MKTLTVPKDQIIRVVDSEGATLFEEDAILLRAMLDDAISSSDSVSKQYENLKKAIDEKYECDITYATLYLIGAELDQVLLDLKKTT